MSDPVVTAGTSTAAPVAAAATPASPAPVAAAAQAAPPPAPRIRVQAPPLQRAAAAPVAAAPTPTAAPDTTPDASAPKRTQVSARVAAELADLRAKAKVAASNTAALVGYAETALATLSPELQAYIKDMVGDDPAAILKAVTGASKHKLTQAQAAGLPPGATTAPTASPTAAPASLNDNDVKAAKHYSKLVDAGKSGAANTWMAMHGAAIERGMKKISAN